MKKRIFVLIVTFIFSFSNVCQIFAQNREEKVNSVIYSEDDNKVVIQTGKYSRVRKKVVKTKEDDEREINEELEKIREENLKQIESQRSLDPSLESQSL